MTPRERHIALMEATEYTTDPDTYRTLMHDTWTMWAAWNACEFGNALRPLAVAPTDDTLMLGVNDEEETTVGGCYSRDGRYILIDTAAQVRHTQEGLGQTLYHHVAETLLHEMIHEFCHENGIKDTDADGTHNEAFRDTARAHGLVCHIGTQGWNLTHVRKGHWAPFYRMLPTELARRMRNTHIPFMDTEEEE